MNVGQSRTLLARWTQHATRAGQNRFTSRDRALGGHVQRLLVRIHAGRALDSPNEAGEKAELSAAVTDDEKRALRTRIKDVRGGLERKKRAADHSLF